MAAASGSGTNSMRRPACHAMLEYATDVTLSTHDLISIGCAFSAHVVGLGFLAGGTVIDVGGASPRVGNSWTSGRDPLPRTGDRLIV
jgi:hypothetical protein